MVELHFEADIDASAERVFAILADLRHYDQWLPGSSAFHGTTFISAGPIAVGTTYVEPGPLGTRHGIVTAMVPPTQLDFEQPMTLRPRFLGVIDIRLFHTLTPTAGDGVHLLRRLELRPRGVARLLTAPLVGAFRTENQRMMKILKEFAESDRQQRATK